MTEDWEKDALCAETDPELFFTGGYMSTAQAEERINKAKSICGRCTVTEQCLQYALDNDINEGVWGGLTEAERKKLKRQARTSA